MTRFNLATEQMISRRESRGVNAYFRQFSRLNGRLIGALCSRAFFSVPSSNYPLFRPLLAFFLPAAASNKRARMSWPAGWLTSALSASSSTPFYFSGPFNRPRERARNLNSKRAQQPASSSRREQINWPALSRVSVWRKMRRNPGEEAERAADKIAQKN